MLAGRFFNVFGPFQSAGHAYAAVTPNFVLAALTGEPLVVHGDGEQTRDFTYVGSLCNVIAEAVVRNVSYDGAVNCAFGTRTSLNEYIRVLQEVVGQPLTVQYTDPRAGDVRDSQADTSRLREIFPDVQPVALREGLQITVDWYRGYLTASGARALAPRTPPISTDRGWLAGSVCLPASGEDLEPLEEEAPVVAAGAGVRQGDGSGTEAESVR